MKKILFFLLLAAFTFTYAQDDKNCYEQYAEKFNERGAKKVEDGWHEDVVITIRKGKVAECFYGKVKVENGAVVSMYLRYADGTYERTPMQKKYKHELQEATITNGISKSKITVDDELINVVFVEHIKPPKKKYQAAPMPDDL